MKEKAGQCCASSMVGLPCLYTVRCFAITDGGSPPVSGGGGRLPLPPSREHSSDCRMVHSVVAAVLALDVSRHAESSGSTVSSYGAAVPGSVIGMRSQRGSNYGGSGGGSGIVALRMAARPEVLLNIWTGYDSADGVRKLSRGGGRLVAPRSRWLHCSVSRGSGAY